MKFTPLTVSAAVAYFATNVNKAYGLNKDKEQVEEKPAGAVSAQKYFRHARRDARELEVVSYEGSLTGTGTDAKYDCTGCVSCFANGDRDWWKLVLQAGTTYQIDVSRIDCGFDPYAYLYYGAGVGDNVDVSSLLLVAFSDDAVALGCSDCYADPRIFFTPQVSGDYTLAVRSFFSCGGCPADGNFDYSIIVDPPLKIEKAIDVQPGDGIGCLNINGRGKIPVAILSEDDGEEARAIIQTSLELKFEKVDGSSFALPVSTKKNGKPHCAVEDANNDTIADLVCHFNDDLENYDAELKNATATVDGEFIDDANNTRSFVGIPDTICIVKQPEPIGEVVNADKLNE